MCLTCVREPQSGLLLSDLQNLGLPSDRHDMAWFGISPGSYFEANLAHLGMLVYVIFQASSDTLTPSL